MGVVFEGDEHGLAECEGEEEFEDLGRDGAGGALLVGECHWERRSDDVRRGSFGRMR